jgi:hypothetical protein
MALYELLVQGRENFNSDYKIGTRCRNLIKDLRAWRKQKTTKLDLGYLLTGRDHLDLFAIDDPWPQVVELFRLARSLTGKVFKRPGFGNSAWQRSPVADAPADSELPSAFQPAANLRQGS